MKREKALHDEIARVANELYEKGGRVSGNELKDWLEAEKIVLEKHGRHLAEVEKKVDTNEKPQKGYRRTVKKEGFYKKG
ncbi:MAG: DUF2934 domain-containing protein [Acidobacteriota bacterium]